MQDVRPANTSLSTCQRQLELLPFSWTINNQARDAVFKVFLSIERDHDRLVNELHDVKGDYHVTAADLEDAKRTINDLRGQISQLERKLKLASQTSMTTPRKHACDNSMGTHVHPIPINNEEDDSNDRDFYSDDYMPHGAHIYTPSRPPPDADAPPLSYTEVLVAPVVIRTALALLC